MAKVNFRKKIRRSSYIYSNMAENEPFCAFILQILQNLYYYKKWNFKILIVFFEIQTKNTHFIRNYVR